MVEMGRRRGRPRKFNEPEDKYHKVARELAHQYYIKNREACLLASKENITVEEARKRLGIKAGPEAKYGKRRKGQKRKKK